MPSSSTDGRSKYLRVADELIESIKTLDPHDSLPSERDLMQTFGVSRMTIRRAIEQLGRQGIVYQVQGSGTFVTDPEVVTKTLRLTSFTEDMERRGLTPSSSTLSSSVEPASGEVARRLHLEPGTEVLRLERLRLADGEPMALETCYVPPIGIGWTEFEPAGSLYAQMKAHGINVDRAAQTIEAVNLDRDQAHRLDQPVGAAAFRVTRVSYRETGVPVELAATLYRGDRYDFDLVISREAP